MAHPISSYEDFKALEGREIGVSDWYQINQEQINIFADATHDEQSAQSFIKTFKT